MQLVQKIEDIYFRFDKGWHLLFALFFAPVSLLYCLFGAVKKLTSKREDLGIPVLSIGNLTVGGSGKTPFCLELAKRVQKPCIVLRGYKRASKGLIVVSRFGEILCGVGESGDEAMLYAKSLKDGCVIVSEDRKEATLEAKRLGCLTVLLDDGFGKFGIDKFEILLHPKLPLKNILCLPSGPYRYPLFFSKYADINAFEGVDFKREVEHQADGRYILITAISNPKRLDEFLPEGVEAKYYFADHHYFLKNEIEEIALRHSGAEILCTQKDYVKLEALGIKSSVLELRLEFAADFDKYLLQKISQKYPDIHLKSSLFV